MSEAQPRRDVSLCCGNPRVASLCQTRRTVIVGMNLFIKSLHRVSKCLEGVSSSIKEDFLADASTGRSKAFCPNNPTQHIFQLIKPLKTMSPCKLNQPAYVPFVKWRFDWLCNCSIKQKPAQDVWWPYNKISRRTPACLETLTESHRNWLTVEPTHRHWWTVS